MELIKKVALMAKEEREIKSSRPAILLVPTMGYFHEGHLSLFRAARKRRGRLVVSIFVNPLQFCPGEDFKEYPRDLEMDLALAEKEGVETVFAPDAEDIYSGDFAVTVKAGPLGMRLCGASRPGHFDGVCTVVAKLFNIIQPDVAFFGRKDYQQLLVIRRMAEDLNFAVEIAGMPTIRDGDGLASSSRNICLSPEEREQARSLFQGIKLARRLYRKGERRPAVIEQEVARLIRAQPRTKIDYVKVCHGQSLEEVERVDKGTLLALAVFVGKTRLIDNCIFGEEE